MFPGRSSRWRSWARGPGPRPQVARDASVWLHPKSVDPWEGPPRIVMGYFWAPRNRCRARW
eukprot:26769-Pyramimonas_sp.AAC.1